MPPMPKPTRANACMYIFDSEKDILPEQTSVLPTYEDIIRCFQSVRLKLKGNGSKQPEAREVASIVATKIEEVWKKASIPTTKNIRRSLNLLEVDILLFLQKNWKHLKLMLIDCLIFAHVNVKTKCYASVTKIGKYQIWNGLLQKTREI